MLKQRTFELSHGEQLQLYGLFKQAARGDCTDEAPPVYEVVQRDRWAAWARHKGMSQDHAVTAYASLVRGLFERNQQHALVADLPAGAEESTIT